MAIKFQPAVIQFKVFYQLQEVNDIFISKSLITNNPVTM